MVVLELKDVKKDYKLQNKEVFNALTDINISFEKGELVSIVGESGSGKSTLMNLIGGLDSDYTGIINVSGKDLKSFKEKDLDDHRKKKIGFVFQSFNLIPHLSVIDNVTVGMTLSNEKESFKVEKATQLLTKLGLQDQLHKKPTQLSGGQKQRVAIARALINDPDIILADEPTGALDSITTSQILEILKEIADEGKLVIMVTHSEKVSKISSRVVEISDGRIIRDERNKNYQRNEKALDLIKEEKKENKKEGHLSLWSAIKLSFHNMWAKRTKNFLMAVGVSISLISLILMLSLGSGLTGYISSLAADYTNPTVATISKESSIMQPPKEFNDTEVSALIDELNTYFEEQGSEFRVSDQGEHKNLYLGIGYPTLDMLGKLIYTDSQTGIKDEEEIFYFYTTPPYFNEDILITENGWIPNVNMPEILLSQAALDRFDFENPEDIVGKTMELRINIAGVNVPPPNLTVTGIADSSMFPGTMVVYVDYQFLQSYISTHCPDEQIGPTLIYIQTNSEKTTEMINTYIAKNRKDLSGSMEDKLVSMFNELMDTFSIALAIIAGISLTVALIMILVVLYMSVSERTREIGVLKSIGARKKDIKLIFSSESFLIGLLSGITGIILTLIIGAVLIFVFNTLLGFAPISMKWYYFIEALGISIVISVLAGLYPASKAAKLDPVESLRHE